MTFGERTLRINTKGRDVIELQLRLAGFLGTVWDGDFGRKTKEQVIAFQRDFMEMEEPTGIVEADTYKALDEFAEKYPIDFTGKIRCPDKKFPSTSGLCPCGGFGQQRFKKLYIKNRVLFWSQTGKSDYIERRHQYEYPGIHKAVLHTYRAFLFYAEKADTNFKNPKITSGYRCHLNNTKKRKRGSTNHMGKALDFQFELPRSKQWVACNKARALLVEKSNCQVRWNFKNRKSLEPGFFKEMGRKERPGEFVAGTWVHLDVRQYEPDQYLQDHFFVTNKEALDSKELGENA